MSEFEVESFSCCFGFVVFVLLFVHLGYELLVVGGDFEQVFFHEEFEVVEYVFFFGVGEEDAVDVSDVDGFEFVDYCVSYACFVHV